MAEMLQAHVDTSVLSCPSRASHAPWRTHRASGVMSDHSHKAGCTLAMSSIASLIAACAGVGLDPSMAAMQLRTGLLTPAWLQDVAVALDVPPVRCVVVAANELPLSVRPVMELSLSA